MLDTNKRLLSRKEACAYVGLGLNRGVEFCDKAGARIQIGTDHFFRSYLSRHDAQNTAAAADIKNNILRFYDIFQKCHTHGGSLMRSCTKGHTGIHGDPDILRLIFCFDPGGNDKDMMSQMERLIREDAAFSTI